VPFAAALALGSVKQIGWRLALRSALTVCLSAAVGIGAWQLRNQVVAGTWVFSGVELEARSDRSVMVESLNGTRQGWSVEGESSPDLGHAPRLVVLGATILQNAAGLMLGPGEHRFIRLLGYAAPDAPGLDLRLLVVAPEPNRPSLTPGEFAAKWLRALHWPMLPFAVAALHIVALNVGLLAWAASAWRRRAFSRRDLLMWGILGYFLIVSYSSSRFRVPIMPMLSVYAAAGWLRLRPFRRTEEPVANVCDRHTWSI
jgi:hypothetical protein